VTLSVGAATGSSLARGFVGLTFEASVLGTPALDASTSNLGQFLSALDQGRKRSRGILRFGGSDSDDKVVWASDSLRPLPAWASKSIGPSDLRALATITGPSGWSVDLGVNLLHPSVSKAAKEVASARQILGTQLHEVSIGNEPDLYTLFNGIPVNFEEYIARVHEYKAAIRALTPSVKFAGPDFYSTSWLDAFAWSSENTPSELSTFSYHFYPAYDCNRVAISASALLSEASFTSEKVLIDRASLAARLGGHTLALDEFNSISCGHYSPVEHQFASALWAVHGLLLAASRGVVSVGVQMTPSNCNSYTPLCIPDPNKPGEFAPRPIFSAMELVAHLETGVFLGTTSSASLPAGVNAWALRGADGTVSVVVENTRSKPLSALTLSMPGRTLVSTTELTAPALDATDGVTLITTPSSSSSLTGLHVAAQSVKVFTLGS